MSHTPSSPARQEDAHRAAIESGEPLQTLVDFVDDARAHWRAEAERSLQLVRHCVAAVLSISSVTEARLGADAPAMSKLRDTLRAVERALLQLWATGFDIVAQDAPQAPLGAVTDKTSQKKARPGDAARANETLSGAVLSLDAAALLGRRIDAIRNAA